MINFTEESWNGIKGAFQEYPIKFENYPWELERLPGNPIPGIHVPNRWGQYRKGHKIGRYNEVWAKIEKEYNRELIARLDALYPPTYEKAKERNPIQRLNFCLFIHNYEGALRCIEEIEKSAYQSGVEDTLKKYGLEVLKRKPGRPKTRRQYKSRKLTDKNLAMADLFALYGEPPKMKGDPLIDEARALRKSKGILTIGIIQKSLRISKQRAARLFNKLMEENRDEAKE